MALSLQQRLLVSWIALLGILGSADICGRIEAAAEEGEFEYGDGPLGPANWGKLQKGWAACGKGRSQSPVDILKKHLVPDDSHCKLTYNYSFGSAHLSIRQHDVAIEWSDGGGGVVWINEWYKLLNLHLHSPSEHTINGFRYPLETHAVHEGPRKELLVVSSLYRYGKEDGLLTRVSILRLMDEFPYLHASGNTAYLIGNASLADMKLGNRYYRYMGSLTTPPCSEGVTWIVLKKKRNVAKQQVDEILKAQLGENARPQQPLNGRTVYKHDE